jgi:hypothetical protein
MLLSVLAACGGGEEEPDPGEEDADATGIYQGTMMLEGTNRNFVAAVAADGVFVAGIGPATGMTNSRTMIGMGAVNGATFDAVGTAYAPAISPFANTTTRAALSIDDGTVIEQVQLGGTYAAGGESGTFTLNYRTEMSLRGAQLSRIAGTYTLYPAPPSQDQNASMNIDATGVMGFQAGSGCAGTGNVTIPDPAVNVYRFTLTLSGCPGMAQFTVGGLVTLEDSPLGGMNNRVIMFGATSARDIPFGFTGVK